MWTKSFTKNTSTISPKDQPLSEGKKRHVIANLCILNAESRRLFYFPRLAPPARPAEPKAARANGANVVQVGAEHKAWRQRLAIQRRAVDAPDWRGLGPIEILECRVGAFSLRHLSGASVSFLSGMTTNLPAQNLHASRRRTARLRGGDMVRKLNTFRSSAIRIWRVNLLMSNSACAAVAVVLLTGHPETAGGNAMAAPAPVDYQALTFPYLRAPDLDAPSAARRPVVVVGAGPVGLAAAIDLAQGGTEVLLLDDDDRLSNGSRAICFAKRTLEIFDRLGCGEPMVQKGVGWNKGRVFFREKELYSFNLLPEDGHHRPAFINLQQYYVEGYLVDRARELPNLEIRWKNRVAGVTQDADEVSLQVETPDGTYALYCEYLIAADGARSFIRRALGHESKGQTFKDRFLIADVRMEADFPAERWFWFDPPFHPNQSVLLHRQSDNVWRIDFQLGWDADPVAERQPERVLPRVQALLGKQAKFELVWASVYTFSCLRMASFRDGRVLFAGDSAHGVSPFGARGANSGVQDAENLSWKLRLVLEGKAPERLLDSYGHEREFAADENILNSTRSTDFITPKSEVSRTFRNATLELARDCEFARQLVNSGRLSKPSTLASSPLNTPDEDAFTGTMAPGAPCTDAPVHRDGREAWLINQIAETFTLLHFARDGVVGKAQRDAFRALAGRDLPVRTVVVAPRGVSLHGAAGLAAVEDGGLAFERFDAHVGATYLLRPDQHVCARWRKFDPAKVEAALDRATARA
jgi:3-(3-hydroxy-phenyl)propionate hydroxylase